MTSQSSANAEHRIAVDIVDPALISAISQFHQFNITKRTLHRLAESARDIGLQFVIGGETLDLNEEQRDALARSLAYLHVSLNYPFCPDEWEKIADDRIRDGWALGLLLQLLEELAQANVHLAAFASGKIEQPWPHENPEHSGAEISAPRLPAGETGWPPFLTRFIGCVLGSFIGVLLAQWLVESVLVETPPQISFPAYGEIEEFDLPDLPLPIDQFERLVEPVRPMEVE
ncbi:MULTISPECIES: hypothetical protein [Thalassospira]|jgi:hypothetical protein|uniref:hypothetical protein n=1 Tax=Thalassospira TaxID=168934 RepID=UPI00080FB530|nr:MULTISPECIES: hypothetical protein [Thalassospira]MAB31828.1 hypothetical protein [Thalassospira sp.]MAL29809.1 hypothetical protein [Thalassospira sp.]MBL4841312.1 hypothetical protein [Thalassospira sp.]MCD1596328.1 hypothetical protein [Thalassospira xiamenensis]MDM7978043.1 hypothetical protein [Thalassospira xiamenensis]|tara:strand:+ start:1008 stop:1697 length:690 start_codon:yes stop_codon:yes gene_type:complete